MDYEIGQIGNMDETPMTFDMAGFMTVNKKRDKTVTVNTTGSEKAHFMVILSCLADGMKLPVMVIFMGKSMPKYKLPIGVIEVGRQASYLTMAKKCVEQTARCFTKEEN